MEPLQELEAQTVEYAARHFPQWEAMVFSIAVSLKRIAEHMEQVSGTLAEGIHMTMNDESLDEDMMADSSFSTNVDLETGEIRSRLGDKVTTQIANIYDQLGEAFDR